MASIAPRAFCSEMVNVIFLKGGAFLMNSNFPAIIRYFTFNNV